MLLPFWLLMLGFFAGWRGRAVFEGILDAIDASRERRRVGEPEEESVDTWLNRVEDEYTLAAFREAGLEIVNPEHRRDAVRAAAEWIGYSDAALGGSVAAMQASQQLQGNPPCPPQHALALQQQLMARQGAPGFNPFHGIF